MVERVSDDTGLSQAEPEEVSALSGFDPSRGDAEMLAILLWDYFGPRDPRSLWQIEAGYFTATDEQVALYRECAKHIAESLLFYRNIEFDAAIAMEARQGGDGETRLHAKHDSAGRKASPNTSPISQGSPE